MPFEGPVPLKLFNNACWPLVVNESNPGQELSHGGEDPAA